MVTKYNVAVLTVVNTERELSRDLKVLKIESTLSAPLWQFMPTSHGTNKVKLLTLCLLNKEVGLF